MDGWQLCVEAMSSPSISHSPDGRGPEKWRDRKMKKKGMNKHQHDCSIHDTTINCSHVYQVSSLPAFPEKKCDEKFKWRERKSEKGKNKQQHPDFGIHDTTTRCSCVYQVLRVTSSLSLSNTYKSIMKTYLPMYISGE